MDYFLRNEYMGAENSKPATKGSFGKMTNKGTLVKKEESDVLRTLQELTKEIKELSADQELNKDVFDAVVLLCEAFEEYKKKILDRLRGRELYQIYPGSSEITGFNLR